MEPGLSNIELKEAQASSSSYYNKERSDSSTWRHLSIPKTIRKTYRKLQESRSRRRNFTFRRDAHSKTVSRTPWQMHPEATAASASHVRDMRWSSSHNYPSHSRLHTPFFSFCTLSLPPSLWLISFKDPPLLVLPSSCYRQKKCPPLLTNLKRHTKHSSPSLARKGATKNH